MNKPTLKEQAHGEIEKIFRILLPQNGLSVREEQITLCHAMLDTLLKNNIALCDAGVGIGKTYRDLNEYADFIDNTRLILTILDSPMPVFSSSVFRNIVSRITVTHETLRFQLVNGLELEEERISGG